MFVCLFGYDNARSIDYAETIQRKNDIKARRTAAKCVKGKVGIALRLLSCRFALWSVGTVALCGSVTPAVLDLPKQSHFF